MYLIFSCENMLCDSIVLLAVCVDGLNSAQSSLSHCADCRKTMNVSD